MSDDRILFPDEDWPEPQQGDRVGEYLHAAFAAPYCPDSTLLRRALDQHFAAQSLAAPQSEDVRREHKYPGIDANGGFCFTSDCEYGCGCWTGGTRSGGPEGVDPFGECPNHPLKEAHNEQG